MTTLDRLRDFHRSVCRAWRKQNEPCISEAEADVINYGLMLLEMLVSRSERHWMNPEQVNRELVFYIAKYIRKVKVVFDDNSDIVITEDKRDE